jgi:tRNA threonylcarbamoyladenosine biosynthesis protein TsaB
LIVLAIDTSTRWAGVGLLGPGGTVHERVWRSEQNHGRELLPAVDSVLQEAELAPADVTHIGVAVGPGGFSAVRVGMSAATGLAMPRDVPLAGISTHAIETAPYLVRSSRVRPLFSVLPAGRGELAWARFEGSADAVETGVSSPEEFARSAPSDSLVCGESAEELAMYLPRESFVGGAPPTRSPGTLIRLTIAAIERGAVVTGAALKPTYARAPSISKPRPPA